MCHAVSGPGDVCAFALIQVRWRSQARWVAMRTMRAKGVQVEVQQLDAEEKAGGR